MQEEEKNGWRQCSKEQSGVYNAVQERGVVVIGDQTATGGERGRLRIAWRPLDNVPSEADGHGTN
jgi:hypothetical protein